MEGSLVREGSSRGNYSRASSRDRKRLEREYRREQQYMQDGHEIRVDSD